MLHATAAKTPARVRNCPSQNGRHCLVYLTMRSFAVICALAVPLWGCERGPYADWSKAKAAEKADVADANARTALMRLEELSSRVESLESEKSALEDDARSAQREAENARAEADAIRAELQAFRAEYENHRHY